MTIRVMKIEADVVKKSSDDISSSSETSTSTPNNPYSKTISNPYRALVSSGQRAETAPLEEMIQAGRKILRSQRREDAIQSLIGSLMGDNGAPKPSKRDFPLPHVPSLRGEILKDNPELSQRLEPIIGNYEATEAKIKALIKVTNRSLKSGKLGAKEFIALSEHKEDLERLLNKTRVELDKTNALQRIELKERQRIAHEVENERRKALGLPPLP